MTMSKTYITAEVLDPIDPHTNPMWHDQHSLFTTIGTPSTGGREIYVAFSETYKDGNGVSMEKLVIYHAPTGERIRIDIDGSWRQDPKFDRDKAEEKVNAKTSI